MPVSVGGLPRHTVGLSGATQEFEGEFGLFKLAQKNTQNTPSQSPGSRVARDGVAAFDLWGFGAASSRSKTPCGAKFWRSAGTKRYRFSRFQWGTTMGSNIGVHNVFHRCTPTVYPKTTEQPRFRQRLERNRKPSGENPRPPSL